MWNRIISVDRGSPETEDYVKYQISNTHKIFLINLNFRRYLYLGQTEGPQSSFQGNFLPKQHSIALPHNLLSLNKLKCF